MWQMMGEFRKRVVGRRAGRGDDCAGHGPMRQILPSRVPDAMAALLHAHIVIRNSPNAPPEALSHEPEVYSDTPEE